MLFAIDQVHGEGFCLVGNLVGARIFIFDLVCLWCALVQRFTWLPVATILAEDHQKRGCEEEVRCSNYVHEYLDLGFWISI